MVNKEKFGYVFASKMLFEDNRKVMYFYHEKPDSPTDSGWRFFCGEETQEYCDNPDNIAIYSITSVLNVSPDIEKYLDTDKIVAFERNQETGEFEEVDFVSKNAGWISTNHI